MIVREATRADFRAYLHGQDFPPEWCVDDPIGYVADDDGVIVGVGLISRDKEGRWWAWMRADEPLSAASLHRRALSLLDVALSLAGCVYAFCDERQPGAAAWLNRLGFHPDRMMLHPTGDERMAWVRSN